MKKTHAGENTKSDLRSTLLASLVAVKYEDAIDTWQDLLDNDITLTFAKGTTVGSVAALKFIHARQ